MLVSIVCRVIRLDIDNIQVYITALGHTQNFQVGMGEPWLIEEKKLLFNEEEPKKCMASVARRRNKATKQEENAAAIHGGVRHKSSGSLNYLKSDASLRHKYRMECKGTAGSGMRVTRHDLDKLRSECTPGQVPVFLIQFNEPTTLHTQDEWVLVPKTEWEKKVAQTDNDR